MFVLSLLFALEALAQKKKPGMFDFQQWKTPEGHQRDAIKHLAPQQLDLTPSGPFRGEPRKVRVRVYADRDYRSMIVHWRKGFEAQVARVNRVVEAVFNVRLEIESLRQWDSPHAGVQLEAILTDLETLDPGRDVDWTVGLVTPFKGVATSIHQIGGARLLARHFVLRGMDDEKEGQALDREFGLLSPDERARVYGERKTHKETVIFLHEWAHTMGTIHDEYDTAIMHPTYDAKRAAFSEFQKRLISFVLDSRLAAPEEAFPESAGLGALLAEAPTEEGTSKERASIAALAAERARRTRPDTGGPRNQGEARLPDPPAADVEASPKARAPLDAATTYVRQRDLGAAVPLLMDAIPHIAHKDGKTWARLASLATSVGALSMADTALGHVDRGQQSRKLAEQAETRRARIALPRRKGNWGLKADDEPTYAAQFQKVDDLIGKGEIAGARIHLTAFRRTYPVAPGADVLECALEFGAKRLPAAVKACEAALTKSDQTLRAHYLLGSIAASQRRDTVAEKHLRRAILLDPGNPDSWRALGRLYRAISAAGRLAELEAQHEALLSSPLPE